MKSLFKIDNISGGYQQNLIIKDISLEINQGDFLGILGPNGSGKTTLLRLASRAIHPQKGNIFFKEEDIFRMELKEFCRQAAFVSQDTPSDFAFTVFETVLLGRIPHLKRLQPETKQDVEIARESLKMTDVLELADKKINEISAGERQRVMIARALAAKPIILFLDEPTSHLDIGHQIQVMDLLRKLNRQRDITIVMVLHDLNLAAQYCNRIVLFDQGKIFKEGSPMEALTYQNIEAVYKTVVVVNPNPMNGKPYVFLVPETE